MFKPEKESVAGRPPTNRSTTEGSLSLREPNPDVNQPPPERKPPTTMPPDQPGIPEQEQPDPPPKGDPPSDEPTRLIALRLYETTPRITFSLSHARWGDLQ